MSITNIFYLNHICIHTCMHRYINIESKRDKNIKILSVTCSVAFTAEYFWRLFVAIELF